MSALSALLEAWSNRQPLPKETVILLMREFALRCLESAYRSLGLKEEEIHRLLKVGRLSSDQVGHYKQSSYRQVGGLTPFFKQFVENSSTWERVMIGTDATGGNDWLASLRINTRGGADGYRMAGIYTGLLRWGNSGMDLQERMVPAAQRAWEAHGWTCDSISTDQTKDHMWGTAWHPGEWEGTEEELIQAIGARLAALVPVLRSRHQWRARKPQQALYPRFETLGKVEEALGRDPVSGSYELAFRTHEIRLIGEDATHVDATVDSRPIRFRISRSKNGERTLTSCEGAYSTIRELGTGLGMRHGDRAAFRPGPDGRYTVERAAPPGLLVKLGTVGEGEAAVDGAQKLEALERYLGEHTDVWFGVHSGTTVSAGRQHEFRNALDRNETVSVYLSAGVSGGGSGDVTQVADLIAIKSSAEPTPPPGEELLPGPTEGQACRVWLRLTNLRRERIALSEFVLDSDGTPVERGLRQPLVYVRREAAAVTAERLQLLGAAPDLDQYLQEMEQFLEEHGGYMYFWTHGIRPTYRERLEQQGSFTLNLYRAGYVTHTCEVDRFYTTDDRAGMASPEPELTVERDREGTEFEGRIARTWLRVKSVAELPEPVPLETFVEYDSGERLAPQALINAFAYVRRQQEETALQEQVQVRGLAEILEAFAAAPTLLYDAADLINLHHALHALNHKHFVILHGVSGTGKSRFAQAYTNALYGRALTEPDNPHYCLVPVQPTWQDRTPLLGYYNPLTERYVTPDFLAHVLKAAQDPDRPYVICLDEMNLAVVEHYFADFLSAWESGEAITLHEQPDSVDGVPRKLPIPSNIMVIGTVNIDETTHGFSPKVLDRAFTVELTHVDVRGFGQKLVQRTDLQAHRAVLEGAIDLLARLHETLAPYGLHFAYRTVDEICRFLIQNATNGPSLSDADALDLMLVQKVLPKLRGDDRLLPMLQAMKEIAAEHLGTPAPGRAFRSVAAISRMMEDARRYGTFQYWR